MTSFKPALSGSFSRFSLQPAGRSSQLSSSVRWQVHWAALYAEVDGAVQVEYLFLIGLLALAAIASFHRLNSSVAANFSGLGSAVQSSVTH